MEIIFKVIRQQQNSSPVVQTYLVEAEPGNTILDCLNHIKWEQDGTLAFRKNCRNTICGSCAMRINGRSALACKENVGSELARLQQIPSSQSKVNAISEITIAPLGNMPVIKDLVVDMSSLIAALRKQNIYVLLRQNEAAKLYGITFVDNQNKVVFNGSDLGKGYSAAALINYFENRVVTYPSSSASSTEKEHKNKDLNSVNPTSVLDKIQEHTIADKSLLEILFDPEKQSGFTPLQLLQKKCKKKKKHTDY